MDRLGLRAARNSIYKLAHARGGFVAAPGYVHVRTQQEHRLVVKLVHVGFVQMQHRQRRANRTECGLEFTDVTATPEMEEGVLMSDHVL